MIVELEPLAHSSPTLLAAYQDRRRNWRILQEMAGIEPQAAAAAWS